MSRVTELPEASAALFRQAAFAHLAVVDDHGVPHVTPIWADVDAQGRLWFNTAVGRFKDRYLQLGDPVALSVTGVENPYEYTQVRGTVASRDTVAGDAGIDALAKKYMGLDVYPGHTPDETRVTVVVEPTSVTGVGG